MRILRVPGQKISLTQAGSPCLARKRLRRLWPHPDLPSPRGIKWGAGQIRKTLLAQLGRYLRELRGQQRLTVKVAAEKLEWSEAKIWRIETGQTSLRSLDVEAMCKIYAAPAEALMGLARETKTRGWWHAYGDVSPKASTSTSAWKKPPPSSSRTNPNSSPDSCRPKATRGRSSRPTTQAWTMRRSAAGCMCGWRANR